jgi:hypothetical protein
VAPPLHDPDGTTETTPRLKRPNLPLSLPGTVEIKTARDPEPDDVLDETEVRTLPGKPASGPATDPETPRRLLSPAEREPPRPAAGRSAADDSRVAPSRSAPPTTQASEPPTSPRGKTIPADDPATYDDDEESTTTRGPAHDVLDDSITTRAPMVPIEDPTEASSTKKVIKKQAAMPASPADGEAESITTQAPGHLTNMLRVIAAEVDRAIEDDEPIQNQTQVMANAPVRPELAARAAAVPPLEQSSDSGLSIAGASSGSVERASPALLGAAESSSAPPPTTGTGSVSIDPYSSRSRSQSIREVDGGGKKPPYGIIVVAVMTLSITIPVALYLLLHQGPDGAQPGRTSAQPSPDVVPRGTESSRPKLRAVATSAPASASVNGKAAAKPRR